jgi:hypothetical protein
MDVALLEFVGVDLPSQRTLHQDAVGFDILGMGQCPKARGQELIGRIAEHLDQGAIDP